MRKLMVAIDNSPEAWQAAYTAFHVAARTGAKLAGAAMLDRQSQASAERVLKEFETGARAAGVSVETLQLPALTAADLLPYAIHWDGIFLARASLSGEARLNELAGQLRRPLWIISGQRSIRRMLALVNRSRGGKAALNLGLALARRWELDLDLLLAADGLTFEEILPDGTNVSTSSRAIFPLSLNDLQSEILSKQVDLALLGWPLEELSLWEICENLGCLVTICPPGA